MWVDDDIVLTNHLDDMFRRALRRHQNASVLVTRDRRAHEQHPSQHRHHDRACGHRGARVLSEMWRRAAEQREDGVSLATDPQSRGCLHEQQALQEMIELPYWRARWPCSTSDADAYDESTPRLPEEDGGDGFERRTQQHSPEHLSALVASQCRARCACASMATPMAAAGRGDFAGHCSGLSQSGETSAYLSCSARWCPE